MTLAELHSVLKELGIPESKYYLHGLFGSTNDDDKLSLVIRQGRFVPEYEVYYKERGEKHSIRIFHTENEACEYIYKRLIEAQKIENRIR